MCVGAYIGKCDVISSVIYFYESQIISKMLSNHYWPVPRSYYSRLHDATNTVYESKSARVRVNDRRRFGIAISPVSNDCRKTVGNARRRAHCRYRDKCARRRWLIGQSINVSKRKPVTVTTSRRQTTATGLYQLPYCLWLRLGRATFRDCCTTERNDETKINH